VHYFESFEGSMPGELVTLETKGWNDIDRELRNRSSVVVWRGPTTCTPADPPDRCAGPAAEGEYFLAIEREKTPASSSAEFGVTCGACRCCLECRDPAQRTAGETGCLGVTFDASATCSADVPQECGAICASCESSAACPPTPSGSFSMDLPVCLRAAAAHQCAGCAPYDQCVQAKYAENRMCPGGNYPECSTMPPQNQGECNECLAKECASTRNACWACRDADRLQADYPNEPSRWQALRDACTAQGETGCYATPVDLRRSALSDDEQSLESPEISLAGVQGNLQLELQYVPFDVQRVYRRVIQERPRDEWPLEPQEVVVQLCASGCDDGASWTDAELVGGGRAVFPREEQRANGLAFAQQGVPDWRINLAEIAIPETFKTSTFRFRFLPRLEDEARIGVDRISIGSRP
jgi:hypothetical protein